MLAEIIMQKIIILVISLFVWTGIVFSQNNQEFFLAQNSLCSYEEQGMGGDGLVIVKKQQAQTDNAKKNHKTIVCSACNGNGKIGCYLCSGTGKTLKTEVNYYTGSYYMVSVTCNACRGAGAVVCWVCGGDGYINVPTNDSNVPLNSGYNNTGSSHSGKVTCSGCNGTGKCTGCGGTGKQSSTSYYTDGHTIISNCPVCHGTGRCGVCHGTGRL